MKQKQKLELTWIGKENRPRLEPRILLEDPNRDEYSDVHTQPDAVPASQARGDECDIRGKERWHDKRIRYYSPRERRACSRCHCSDRPWGVPGIGFHGRSVAVRSAVAGARSDMCCPRALHAFGARQAHSYPVDP